MLISNVFIKDSLQIVNNNLIFYENTWSILEIKISNFLKWIILLNKSFKGCFRDTCDYFSLILNKIYTMLSKKKC
jgi:hypothetical protein